MKVILVTDVASLGKEGDRVDVSEGYARNYLLPRGLAVQATDSALKEWNSRNDRERKKAAKQLAEAKGLEERLSKAEVTIKAKAGEAGRLFGSITSKDIAEALGKQTGVQIDRKKIQLEENLKALGSYSVKVRLYPDVVASLTVNIVGDEGDEAL